MALRMNFQLIFCVKCFLTFTVSALKPISDVNGFVVIVKMVFVSCELTFRPFTPNIVNVDCKCILSKCFNILFSLNKMRHCL